MLFRSLERIGGRTHYGMTDRYENAAAINALPVGIAKGAVVTRPVKKGEIITYGDVQLPPNSVIVRLRELQDRWMSGELEEAELLRTLNAIAVQNT